MSVDELIKKIQNSMLDKSQPQSLNKPSVSFLKSNQSRTDNLHIVNHTWASNSWNVSSVSTWESNPKDWTQTFQDIMDDTNTSTRDSVVIFFYALVVVVSIFGNILVCRVVFQRSAMRSTTNLFIANLSVSDLLLTIFNIPFNVARLLLENWPFGIFLCRSLPFIQVVSVYVSSFTMTCIALDRHQVITNPLKPRAGPYSAGIKITLIWIAAICLSIPYPMLNNVVEIFTYRSLNLCKVVYPEPAHEYRMWITVLSLLTQYVLPLSVTGIAYATIMRLLWYRQVVGAVTENQRVSQRRSKWKTIKMLMIVVVVFAICWFPLNLYHTYKDLSGDVGPTKHQSSVFLICHWMAMSSVCYNPFIYCWLNDTFRAVARSHFRFLCKIVKGKRSFAASPTENGPYNEREQGSFFHSKNRKRYRWSHRRLAKSSTARTTFSSLHSDGSPQSSFYVSLKRLPTSMVTLIPLKSLPEHQNDGINRTPSIKYTSSDNRRCLSLEFVTENAHPNDRRKSAEFTHGKISENLV